MVVNYRKMALGGHALVVAHFIVTIIFILVSSKLDGRISHTNPFNSCLRLIDAYLRFVVVTYFLIIPILFTGLFLLNRKDKLPKTNDQQKVIFASNFFMITAWIISWIPFSIYFFSVQPWPYSMRHGPDTNYSRNAFNNGFGEIIPQGSVTQIYYRNDSNMLDSHSRTRFQVSDSKAVDRILEKFFYLNHSELSRNAMLGSRNTPKWWKELSTIQDLQFYSYRGGNQSTLMWYSPSLKTVWFESFSN